MDLIAKIFETFKNKNFKPANKRLYDLFVPEQRLRELIDNGNCEVYLYNPKNPLDEEVIVAIHTFPDDGKMLFEPTDVCWGDGFEIEE